MKLTSTEVVTKEASTTEQVTSQMGSYSRMRETSTQGKQCYWEHWKGFDPLHWVESDPNAKYNKNLILYATHRV